MPVKPKDLVLERRCPNCSSTEIAPRYDIVMGTAYYCSNCRYYGPLVVEKDPSSGSVSLDPEDIEKTTTPNQRTDEYPEEVVASGINYVLSVLSLGVGIVLLPIGAWIIYDPYRGGGGLVLGILLLLSGSILVLRSIIALRTRAS